MGWPLSSLFSVTLMPNHSQESALISFSSKTKKKGLTWRTFRMCYHFCDISASHLLPSIYAGLLLFITILSMTLWKFTWENVYFSFRGIEKRWCLGFCIYMLFGVRSRTERSSSDLLFRRQTKSRWYASLFTWCIFFGRSFVIRCACPIAVAWFCRFLCFCCWTVLQRFRV